MWSVLFANATVVAGVMGIAWALSVACRNASFVDRAWGLGFVLVALNTARLVGDGTLRAHVLTVLTVVWGLRMSGYVIWRDWGRPEPSRYQQLRESAGRHFWWASASALFGARGVALWLITIPVQVVWMVGPPGLHLLDLMGITLWLIGFAVEARADLELVRFLRDPDHGHAVCDEGLWRYSRHPNYFGNLLLWSGAYVIAVGSGPGMWTLFSPVIVASLFIHPTGYPRLERSILAHRPDYAAYIRRTNAFFPGHPRQD